MGSVVFGQRAGVLVKLSENNIKNVVNKKNRVFIINQKTFMSPLPPPDYLSQFSIKLRKNDSINTTSISEKLSKIGYIRVSKVSVKGEFSLRGEVLDIFLPLDDYPTRIIFDFDEITNIKVFESDSQTTLFSKDEITIYPMKEVIWTKDFVSTVRQKLEAYQSSSIQNASSTNESFGEHIHLPFTEQALEYMENMLFELEENNQTKG